jgi:hypothetical protein
MLELLCKPTSYPISSEYEAPTAQGADKTEKQREYKESEHFVRTAVKAGEKE